MFENELNKVYEVIDEKDCSIASLKPSLWKRIDKDHCSWSSWIPNFGNLNAPFLIIRQDLVMVWSHILAENIKNMMKTLAHTCVNFVVLNMEMVGIQRNTCFNIHLKNVMSWNTNVISVIFGAQMNIKSRKSE